ncbi:MAG: membrane dipeptidase [Simkaniaceae bacterium]|nr:membrane dipeptidase [Candidatus Sacchlamyda saccharinae]
MKTDIPIIDLHCDLLGCVEYNRGKYGFESPEMNCSVPQLLQGNVKLQVLAVAAITKEDSSKVGKEQLKLYKELLASYPTQVGSFKEFSIQSPKIHFIFAIENASALLDEEEPLDLFFERFENCRALNEILYISLTWNHENRFGGGNATQVGLKNDGEVVLQFLDRKKVAIDLSHTSDRLAWDILDYIEKHSLEIPVIASHSNFRVVKDEKRNLPDELAKEIIRRKGLIGLNFVRRFVGNLPSDFLRHIEHALELGGEDVLCLGADFYGALDIPAALCPGKQDSPFFESFSNSGCYPKWIALLRGSISEECTKKICHQNALGFLGIS